jgi:hypothetical protein
MRYSIWGWNTQRYSLFDSPNGEANGQRPLPRRKVGEPQGKGHQLESLLPVLPRDAVPVGTSEKPQGRIAIHWSSPAVGLGLGAVPIQTTPDRFFVNHPWVALGLVFGGVWLGKKMLIGFAKRM